MERENAGLDTFPKHLIANARRFGSRAAMRHKDYGIWQSWTWAEQLEEVRSFSVALTLAGLKAGDKVKVDVDKIDGQYTVVRLARPS